MRPTHVTSTLLAHTMTANTDPINSGRLSMSEQPASMQTLDGAKRDGTLPALDRGRLRAQLGMEDRITAANIRRATALVLQRIEDYYTVVQYTGPGYVYGRVDSDCPSARYAVARHNYMDDSWIYQEMTPDHPTCTDEKVFKEAGWLCVETACKVAIHEMAVEVPEATQVLGQARYAIRAMCQSSNLSGVNWAESRRRLGTPGIRKILKRLSQSLPNVRIGKGPIMPVILTSGQGGVSTVYRHITDWSLELQQLPKAC